MDRITESGNPAMTLGNMLKNNYGRSVRDKVLYDLYKIDLDDISFNQVWGEIPHPRMESVKVLLERLDAEQTKAEEEARAMNREREKKRQDEKYMFKTFKDNYQEFIEYKKFKEDFEKFKDDYQEYLELKAWRAKMAELADKVLAR